MKQVFDYSALGTAMFISPFINYDHTYETRSEKEIWIEYGEIFVHYLSQDRFIGKWYNIALSDLPIKVLLLKALLTDNKKQIPRPVRIGGSTIGDTTIFPDDINFPDDIDTHRIKDALKNQIWTNDNS